MIFCVEDDSGIRDLMLYTLNASGLGLSIVKHAVQVLGATLELESTSALARPLPLRSRKHKKTPLAL